MARTVPTFCRICEASCGLLAEVEGEQVLELKPDREHVVSQGYVCTKGIRYRDVHHSPDRITQPLKRVGERFLPISWDDALAEIGAKLHQLIDDHGPDAFGMYVGNPVAFNLPHALFAGGLSRAIGTTNVYGAGSQDCNNKFVAAEHMYGSPLLQPIPDLDRTQCLIIIGSNPAVSQMSFVHAPRPIERLREIEKRGGRVVFVNPRRTESAKQVGEQVFIRPGTDVFFLIAFAHELLHQGGEDPRAARHLENLDRLREVVEPWSPERTAPVTGIPAATLRALVGAYRDADGAALYASTGLNQGEEGTHAFWLLSAINAVSGNLDRRGGMLVQKGPAHLMKKLAPFGVGLRQSTSRIGGFPSVMETFPAGILPDEILTPGPGQVRAMLVSAGNPVLSCANSERMREALATLELLVSVDLFRNETGNLAHYILPVPSFLEREDLPLSLQGYQPTPYVQLTDAVVPPMGDTREEWWIFTRLVDAMGLKMFGRAHPYLAWSTRPASRAVTRALQFTPRKLFSAMLAGRGLSPSRLLSQHPHGKRLGEPETNGFLGKWVPRKGGKIDLAPAPFVKAAHGLPRLLETLQPTPGTLKLISKRERHTHNSWMHNVDAFVSGARRTNYAYLHPDDASRLGLSDGDMAEIQGEAGSIRLPVKRSEDLMPGVIAVPHGWGHQQAEGLSVARRTTGMNVNVLAPDGPESLEKLSGMTRLTGLSVRVRPVPTPQPQPAL